MSAHRSRFALCAASVAAGLISVAMPPSASATTYSGNGASGFGGPVGLGTLSVTDSGGNVTLSLTPGGSSGLNDELVLYVDSAPGAENLSPTASPGFYSSNANLMDNSGYGQQTAISGGYTNNPNNGGTTTKSAVTFPTGFYADYAITIDNGTFDVFSLPSTSTTPGNGTLNFVAYEPDNGTAGVYGATIPLSDLGVTPGSTFDFLGTLISTSAYRSDETIGTSVTTPDPAGGSGTNAGFDGSQTFSTYDVYATTGVPEPASIGLVGGLASLLIARRRRSV